MLTSGNAKRDPMIDHIKKLFGVGNSLVFRLHNNYFVLPKCRNGHVLAGLKSAFENTFKEGDFFSGADYSQYASGAIVMFISQIMDFVAMAPTKSGETYWVTAGRGMPVKECVIVTAEQIEKLMSASARSPETPRSVH